MKNVILAKGSEREVSLTIDDYFNSGYFSLDQLFSFAYQINHIYDLKPQNIFEVGIGNGIVSSYFKNAGYRVVTNDINPKLYPDNSYPIEELSIHTSGHDLIVACEVLEHIEFVKFHVVLKQFSKSAQRLYLTLPSMRKRIGCSINYDLPFNIKGTINLNLFLKRKRNLSDSMHFWELFSSKKTSLKKVLLLLNDNYKFVSFGYYPLNPYHYYFICSNEG